MVKLAMNDADLLAHDDVDRGVVTSNVDVSVDCCLLEIDDYLKMIDHYDYYCVDNCTKLHHVNFDNPNNVHKKKQ